MMTESQKQFCNKIIELKKERHTIITPYKGYTAYRTSWGTSGSEPNGDRTSDETVKAIKERYEGYGSTVEIIKPTN
jgi:hypothetical protein